MAKKAETLEGLTRVADAAEEQFKELLEQSGITEEQVIARQEEKASKDNDTEEGNEEATSERDGNTMPTPENVEGGEEVPQNGVEMAAAQAGVEGGTQPPMEIPPEAQQVMAATQGGEAATQDAQQLSPDEVEMLKQQQLAAMQQQQAAAQQ